MWVNFLESVTSLAAVFCNRWSHFSCVSLRPWSSELHVSRLEVMSTWVSSSTTGWLICLQIIQIFLIDTHTALDTFTICLSMERFSSMIMPRFVTLLVGMMVSLTLIYVMLTFDLCSFDSTTMNYVFPLFSFRKFRDIHWRSLSRQASISSIASLCRTTLLPVTHVLWTHGCFTNFKYVWWPKMDYKLTFEA